MKEEEKVKEEKIDRLFLLSSNPLLAESRNEGIPNDGWRDEESEAHRTATYWG